MSFADQPLTIAGAFCLAPLRAHIPSGVWSQLPRWFLNSGVLDSYDASDQLKAAHGSHVKEIFVFPSAAEPPPLPDSAQSTLGRRLVASHVSPTIIHLLLAFKILKEL